MAAPTYLLRPASLCIRCFAQRNLVLSSLAIRGLATTSDKSIQEIAPLSPPPPPPHNASPAPPNQENSTLSKPEKQLVGSRRRRAAISSTTNIPFEQLPYQCFQEARKVLQADREEKLKKIEVERKRIAKVQAQDAAELGGEARKIGKLVAMHKYLEHLKILADSNDPVIKKRFEDGLGISVLQFYSQFYICIPTTWSDSQRILPGLPSSLASLLVFTTRQSAKLRGIIRRAGHV